MRIKEPDRSGGRGWEKKFCGRDGKKSGTVFVDRVTKIGAFFAFLTWHLMQYNWGQSGPLEESHFKLDCTYLPVTAKTYDSIGRQRLSLKVQKLDYIRRNQCLYMQKMNLKVNLNVMNVIQVSLIVD